jgi:hypothetical protein
MLNVVLLSVIMVIVMMLSVVILNVMVPPKRDRTIVFKVEEPTNKTK